MPGGMKWEQVLPPFFAHFVVRKYNNIIKGVPIRGIMTDITEEEEGWIQYFDENYTKREMIIKYIRRVRIMKISELLE